jgi:class 3 adenylate cyclase/CHASE2 domain-containing sensor protein
LPPELKRRAKPFGLWLAVAVCATSVAWAAAQTTAVHTLENLYYDAWHALGGVRYAPRHVAVVAIDDDTLAELKDDPLAFWAPHFARALDVLTEAGAKVIGFDLLYQVSAEAWLRKLKLQDSAAARSYDAPLRRALARGNVVLITQLVPAKDGAELLLPPPEELALLPHGVADLGVGNLFPDEDKHVRHFQPFVDPDPAKPGAGFAMQLALRAAGVDPAASDWRIGGAEFRRDLEPRAIGFAGPAGTVPTISMKALLSPNAQANPEVRALRDKVVIVGPTSAGLGDSHFTPYSRGARAEQMSGPEIHANAVESILSGRVPRPLGQTAALLYLGVVAALAAWLFLRAGIAASVIGAAAGLALSALIGDLAMGHDLIVPVALPQAAIAAALLLSLALRFTGEERERRRVRAMFGRYVSDEVVAKLLADDARPDLGGETHTVTVLFSDIRSFTTISEKLAPHEVVEMLNEYFSRVCEPILAEGGTVDKYIGDAVMALFGAPVAYPDHARRALRAALGMARAAEEFRGWMESRFAGRGLPSFGIGVGLCTGEAVIGDIGTPRRRDFTAIGDTVNAASRLEGVTKDLKCVIAAADSTLRAAGAGVRTGKVETVTVKGRIEPIRVYEILALDTPQEATRGKE